MLPYPAHTLATLPSLDLTDYFVSMDPITTANKLGDDGPEAGVSVAHYMNTGAQGEEKGLGGGGCWGEAGLRQAM